MNNSSVQYSSIINVEERREMGNHHLANTAVIIIASKDD